MNTMDNVMLLSLQIKTKVAEKVYSKKYNYNPSLGLIYMGTYLELHGYKTYVIDEAYEDINVYDIIEKIRREKPILVGISCYSENIDLAKQMAKFIKIRFRDVKILLGGAHASLDPEYTMKSRYVDFVIKGEGEMTFLELLEAIKSHEQLIQLCQIEGLVYKKEGRIINNKRRRPIEDLNLLPLPKREIVGIDKYNLIVNVSTSRGCPGNCIYCAATALSGARYRCRDEMSVFAEMKLLEYCLKERLKVVYIIDDTFTAIPRRIDGFIDYVKKYKLRTKWRCESRVDVMTEELLYKIAENGCDSIQYGIESGSQEVLDKIQKNVELKKALKIIDFTYKQKILVCLSFIIGHYCDTVKTMQQTSELIKYFSRKYPGMELALSYNTPFPGTWQYTHRDKIGLKLTTYDLSKYTLTQPIVETANFTLKDQKNIYCKTYPFLWENYKKEG